MEQPPVPAPRPPGFGNGYQSNPLAADGWVDDYAQQDNYAHQGYADDPPPPGATSKSMGGLTGIVDNEGGGSVMRTEQDGIEFIKKRGFEERFDDPASREPTVSHKGVGFIFLLFSILVIVCMAVSIEIIHGGNIWGLGETLGLGHLFPVTYEAPQYIPPRSCGDKNGDGVPDEYMFNCSAGSIRAAGMPAGSRDFTTYAVVSPRNEIFCTPEGQKCQETQCCVDLGAECAPGQPWELGDGGCAAGFHTTSSCQETRMPDAPTATACKILVEQANADYLRGIPPTVYPNPSYPNPNTWPPTVNGVQMNSASNANGVSWGRGSEPDRERIRISLVDTDINHNSYKQCWAEFGMTEVQKNEYRNGKLVDMTDLYQTCRLS